MLCCTVKLIHKEKAWNFAAVQAMDYRSRILQAVPDGIEFEPLMTLYLTDDTTPDDVHTAKGKGVVAFKLYPAGATTNSDSGVTDIHRCIPTLQTMAEVRHSHCSCCDMLSQPSVSAFKEALFRSTFQAVMICRLGFCFSSMEKSRIWELTCLTGRRSSSTLC